jgi:cephalosporin hydroxylase
MNKFAALAAESLASQDKFELEHLLRVVGEINPKVVVEIGGGSLRTWQDAFKPAVLIGIDFNRRPELYDFKMIFADSTSDQAIETLKKYLGDVLIDFLFIDGDHRYWGVKKDFQNYEPLVRPGGMIAFHDTNSRGIEGVQVDMFMKELDESHSFKTIDIQTDRMSPGTRVIIK